MSSIFNVTGAPCQFPPRPAPPVLCHEDSDQFCCVLEHVPHPTPTAPTQTNPNTTLQTMSFPTPTAVLPAPTPAPVEVPTPKQDEEVEEEVGVRRVPRESEMLHPCAHNRWAKQTKKRGKLVLKCMECTALWKTYPEFHTKCTDFHNGKCERGAECAHPHIYARRRREDTVEEAGAAEQTQTQTAPTPVPIPFAQTFTVQQPAAATSLTPPPTLLAEPIRWSHDPYST